MNTYPGLDDKFPLFGISIFVSLASPGARGAWGTVAQEEIIEMSTPTEMMIRIDLISKNS